jgi:murein DD-endopeptidase MepM/ murein hydrolase activator NlpD
LNQPYFIVVLAHSFHGRLRRIHIPYQAIYGVMFLALLGAISLFGIIGSYARMVWKVADYNNLRSEFATLRQRYHNLEKQSRQTGQQLASLQLLASEVSVAYGLKRRIEGPGDISAEGRLLPTVRESLEEYDFLRNVKFGHHWSASSRLFQASMLPSIWPIDGRLLSSFGHRIDPFSGEGAVHTGVDISGTTGTPVKAAADGVVDFAEYSSGYGKLVVVEHGNSIETYYAHLSTIRVVAGQAIRRGEVIGLVGGTGRVTSPHLHYEVRRGGAPVNPYQYLKTTIAGAAVAPAREYF